MCCVKEMATNSLTADGLKKCRRAVVIWRRVYLEALNGLDIPFDG